MVHDMNILKIKLKAKYIYTYRKYREISMLNTSNIAQSSFCQLFLSIEKCPNHPYIK